MCPSQFWLQSSWGTISKLALYSFIWSFLISKLTFESSQVKWRPNFFCIVHTHLTLIPEYALISNPRCSRRSSFLSRIQSSPFNPSTLAFECASVLLPSVMVYFQGTSILFFYCYPSFIISINHYFCSHSCDRNSWVCTYWGRHQCYPNMIFIFQPFWFCKVSERAKSCLHHYGNYDDSDGDFSVSI